MGPRRPVLWTRARPRCIRRHTRPDAASAPPLHSRPLRALRAPVSARLDDLTRLPLRAAFHAAVADALVASGGTAAVSMLVMDVDQFKLINDTFGHLQGDDVLRTVADILRSSLRTSDMPA